MEAKIKKWIAHSTLFDMLLIVNLNSYIIFTCMFLFVQKYKYVAKT